MPKILVGASVKEFEKIAEYHSGFDHLEIDLNCVVGDFVKTIRNYSDKVYSVHLSHHSTAAAVSSMRYVKACNGKVAVFHPEYPKNFDELVQDIRIIGKYAAKYGVPVMVENLADRKKKSGWYDGARSPITICQALEMVGDKNLGLCLDTGHAVCNEMTEWTHPLVYRWLRHIHLSDSVVGKDLHLPFSIGTSYKLKSGIRRILSHAEHDIMVILENNTLQHTVKSYNNIGRKLAHGLEKIDE